MTLQEAYTSLKNLYRQLMFPENPYAPKWTMSQVDEMDVHFFNELMSGDEKAPEKEVYLNDIW